MSKPRWIALVAAVGLGLGALAFLLLTRPPWPVALAAVESQPAQATAQPSGSVGHVPARGQVAARPVTPAAPGQGVVDLPETPPASEGGVRVRADRVLATVNGKAIALNDLVPLEPGEMEKSMAQSEYRSRLDRAIDTELTFQAAAAQGVTLTTEQQARVDNLAQRRKAALEDYKALGISWSSATPAQAEFERRVTTALLLQQNLVAKASRAAPSPEAAAQARYEQARREVLATLRAKGNVSIPTAP